MKYGFNYIFWNKRIRTFEYSYQKRAPCHLAIFHRAPLSIIDQNPKRLNCDKLITHGNKKTQHRYRIK